MSEATGLDVEELHCAHLFRSLPYLLCPYASVVVWISMWLGLFQYRGYASQLVLIQEFTCFKGNVGQIA